MCFLSILSTDSLLPQMLHFQLWAFIDICNVSMFIFIIFIIVVVFVFVFVCVFEFVEGEHVVTNVALVK